MIRVHQGQCGICAHFGEHHGETEELHQIRTTSDAPELFIEECGHPQHAQLHLRVTAVSGCDAFEAVQVGRQNPAHVQ